MKMLTCKVLLNKQRRRIRNARTMCRILCGVGVGLTCCSGLCFCMPSPAGLALATLAGIFAGLGIALLAAYSEEVLRQCAEL